jgi:hypothetical protein
VLIGWMKSKHSGFSFSLSLTRRVTQKVSSHGFVPKNTLLQWKLGFEP